MIQKTAHQTYWFDEFTLDLTRGCLFREAVEVKLRPKSFDVLTYLIQNGGRLVSKDELIESVWHGMAVTDDSVVQCMKDIRRALGDDVQAIVRTVPRRGYIFDKEVNDNGSAVYVEETSGVHLVIEERAGSDEKAAVSDPERSVAGTRWLAEVIGRHKLVSVLSLSLIVLLGGAGAYGVFRFLRQPSSPPFRSVSISRLTSDGRSRTVAISPDGNYVAYSSRASDDERSALWVRQVAAVNPRQIAPPHKDGYGALVFSPDSNFIYFVQENSLYRMPVFGGTQHKVMENFRGGVTFSPDGMRMAFVRGGQGNGEQRLVLANADGSGEEQVLATRRQPEVLAFPMFNTGPAWSPDGTVIVCPAGDGGFGQAYPLEVRVADGAQRPITTKRWNAVVNMAWMADGSGLLMNAKDNGLDATRQIWHVSYPDGSAQRIYNDDKEHDRISFASRHGLLVSVQREVDSNFWAIDMENPGAGARQITTGTGRQDGYWGGDTTPDGKLVFDSRAGSGSRRDLWVMDADGENQRQLTFDELMEAFATVSPNGRQIVFHLGGKGLWTMDSEGTNREQLADGGMFPAYSPDGKWIYYTLPRDKWSLWKVASTGGEPIRVLDFAVHPAISPDGKLLAYTDVTPHTEPIVRIIPIGGGPALHTFSIGGQNGAIWTLDGKAMTYVTTSHGLAQIVNRPLDGAPSKVLFATRSPHEDIRGIIWSRDGGRLYFSSGRESKDVVMFTLER